LQRSGYASDNELFYVHTDHLGSTAITANASGGKYGELRYKAFGETRYTDGTTPTTYRFTGQREEATLGLYFYGARWYDQALGRFVQADTIVPELRNPQALNRYSYVYNNPLKYVDPSGHDIMIVGGGGGSADWDNPSYYKEWIMAYKKWTEAEWMAFLEAWRNAGEAGRAQLTKETGIGIFNWNKVLGGSRFGNVDDAAAELQRQMEALGMKDVTLVGHSKGGNVIEALLQQYMAENVISAVIRALTGKQVTGFRVKNAVLIDSPTSLPSELIYLAGGINPHVIYAPWTGVNVVAIYNWLDIFAGLDYIPGATNLYVATYGSQGDVRQRLMDVHDVKPWMAGPVFEALNVSMDANAGR